MKAETALVVDNLFWHYCHNIKGLMCLRIQHEKCPMCEQKNPEYIKNSMIFLVTDYKGSPVLAFTDQRKAFDFIAKNPEGQYMIHDTGLVE